MPERSPDVRRKGDDGFSLIELLVSMIVFGIAISMIYSIVVMVQTKTSKVESSAEAVSQLRAGLADIDRQVRSGNVLYAPGNEAIGVDRTNDCTVFMGDTNSGSCMRIFTQADGIAMCVQWQLLADGTRPGTSVLRTRDWKPKWETNPLAPVSGWRVVARGLATNASKGAFTLAGGGAYGARLLDVHLEAVDPRRVGRPIVITSSLAGRNTNYGYDAGQCTPVPPSPAA